MCNWSSIIGTKRLGISLIYLIISLTIVLLLACGAEPAADSTTEERSGTESGIETREPSEDPERTEVSERDLTLKAEVPPTTAADPSAEPSPPPTSRPARSPAPTAIPAPTAAPRAAPTITPTPVSESVRPTVHPPSATAVPAPTAKPDTGESSGTPTASQSEPITEGKCAPGITVARGGRCSLIHGWIEDFSDPDRPKRRPWNRAFEVSANGDACYDYFNRWGTTTCASFGDSDSHLQAEGFEASKNPDGTWTIHSLGHFEGPVSNAPTPTRAPTPTPLLEPTWIISPLGETSPLHEAAFDGSPDAVASLLQQGEDVNDAKAAAQRLPTTWIVRDLTPLHLAALNNTDVEVLAILIRAGGDPEANSGRGETPLHFAAASNTVEVVRLLLDVGADLDDASPVSGSTPLHYAMINSNPGVAALLVELGADIGATNDSGNTPCDLAEGRDRADLVTIVCK